LIELICDLLMTIQCMALLHMTSFSSE